MKIEKYEEYYDKANEVNASEFYNDVTTLSGNEKVILYSLRNEDLYTSYMMYKIEVKKNNLFFLVKVYIIIQLVWFLIGFIIFLMNNGTSVTPVYY